jgi:hypothetical protein
MIVSFWFRGAFGNGAKMVSFLLSCSLAATRYLSESNGSYGKPIVSFLLSLSFAGKGNSRVGVYIPTVSFPVVYSQWGTPTGTGAGNAGEHPATQTLVWRPSPNLARILSWQGFGFAQTGERIKTPGVWGQRPQANIRLTRVV